MAHTNKVGTKFQQMVADTLTMHFSNVVIEQEVYNEKVLKLAAVDVVARLPNGKTLWIPCTKDFNRGTFQQDRLEQVWLASNFYHEDVNVFYCCLIPGPFSKEPVQWTAKQKKLKSVWDELEQKRVIGDLKGLIECLNSMF